MRFPLHLIFVLAPGLQTIVLATPSVRGGSRPVEFRERNEERRLGRVCNIESLNVTNSPIMQYDYEYWYAMGMGRDVNASEMKVVQKKLFDAALEKTPGCSSQNGRRKLSAEELSLQNQAAGEARKLGIVSVSMGAIKLNETGCK
jgi:hypothetical protein